MSDREENDDLEVSTLPTSNLSAEIKELRNKIISIKKTVTKGDKKQKKAVQDEILTLESLLQSKQEELQGLKATLEAETKIEEGECGSEGVSATAFVSKAKLKKERRKEEKAAEWEANRQAALEEIANRPDLALQESEAFNHRLTREGFRILEVSADGHCLFSAIGCQLNPPMDHWQLRTLAATYLKEHRPDFEHFIEMGEEEVSTSIDDRFVEYCRKLESTGMWGGQVELEALSHALNVTITVLQAHGPELNFNFGPSDTKQRIYLSFHRHAFSLGEHYNALLLL